MGDLGDIVEVLITGETAVVDRAAFGRLLIIGEFGADVFPQKYREFSGPLDVSEVFENAYEAEYKAAQAAHSDDLFKPAITIARRTPGTAEVHAFSVERGGTPEDSTVAFSVDGVKIADVAILAADSAEDTADKLAAGINEITAHPYRASVVEDTGSFSLLLTSQYGSNEYEVDFTVTGDVVLDDDAGNSVAAVASVETIADLLNELRGAGANFFGVSMISDRKADVEALAEYVDGEPYLAAVRLHDADGTGVTDPAGAGTAGHTLHEAGFGNTLPWFHSHRWLFPEIRNLAPTIAIDPDTQSSTFALRSPSGLPDSFYELGKTTAQTALDALNINYFKRRGGILIAWPGKTPDGGFADIKFSEFWLTARLQERVFGRIQGTVQGGSKLGYDDDGATVLESEARDMITDAIGADHVTADIDPTYETPRRVDIDSQTVLTREYPPIAVEAYWKGAIHQARFRFVMLF